MTTFELRKPDRFRLAPSLLLLALAFVLPSRAAPPTTRPAPGDPVFFLQFSDPQFGMLTNNKDFAQETANFEFAVATANRLKPAFVVVTGDLTNRAGDAAQVAEFHRVAARLDPAIHLYLAPGNHDVGNKPTPQLIDAYVREFGPDHYRFREGDVVGIVLNASLIQAPEAAQERYTEQLAWLKAELERAKREDARYVIVFQHQPYFLKSADEPDQYFNLPLARRGTYLDLFKQFGVTHVFTGHLHRDAVAVDGPLQIAVTGPVGKPIGQARSGMRAAVARDGKIEHRYYDFGALPTTIDPASWPAGEMLKSGK